MSCALAKIGNARNSATPAVTIRRKFVTIFCPTSCTGERLGQAVCLVHKPRTVQLLASRFAVVTAVRDNSFCYLHMTSPTRIGAACAILVGALTVGASPPENLDGVRLLPMDALATAPVAADVK